MIVKLRITKSQFEKLIEEDWSRGSGNLVVNIYQVRKKEITLFDILDKNIYSTGGKTYELLKRWRTKLDKILPEEVKQTKLCVKEIDDYSSKLEVISIESEPEKRHL